MNNYDDIIGILHFEPKSHPRMSMEKRAAQFSPFQALTGYDELIKETGRRTSNKITLTEEEKELLSQKLQIINNYYLNKEEMMITYFVNDMKKSGGKYITIKKIIHQIDFPYQKVILKDREKINFDDILDIESDLFKDYFIS